ncbi:hypothetical protein [Delftia sp. Cs1-4]|uniref:hypothetical protein n=1 Tax=Delftia sp. (strain Cs1-4) TaxID=742013 RepID=UPI0012F528D1|nr:hypothetical protein [Delftia sp. Cs1-4]
MIQAQIFAKAVDLVDPFVQDRHDADAAVGQPPPRDMLPLMTEEVPNDTELWG